MSKNYCPHCLDDWMEDGDQYACGSTYVIVDGLVRSPRCYEAEIERLKTGTIATLVVEPYRERTIKRRWDWVIEMDGKKVAASLKDFATKKAAIEAGMKLQGLKLDVEVRQ